MVKNEIINFLQKELVGPRPGLPFVQLNGEEVLELRDSPRLRYGAGILFPQSSPLEGQEDDEMVKEESDRGEEDIISETPTDGITGEVDEKSDERGDPLTDTDHEINRANEFSPSALGVTALVCVPEKLSITVSAGQYSKEEIQGAGYYDRKNNWIPAPYCWLRRPLDETVVFDRSELCKDRSISIKRKLLTCNPKTELYLHVHSRSTSLKNPSDSGFKRFITFALVNGTSSSGDLHNESCFFQCSIRIFGEAGEACFLDYPKRNIDGTGSVEELSLEMLYRHRKVYAVGHGCAADWKLAKKGCTEIYSDSMPHYEISPILPTEIKDLDLRMSSFAFSDDDEVIDACEKMAAEYEKWIEERKFEVDEVTADANHLLKAAEQNLESCLTCLSRIRGGIDIIRGNPIARRAFILMNHAMLMQSMHYDLATNGKRNWISSAQGVNLEKSYNCPNYTKSTRSWRPFQLGFILMSLHSIVLENEQSYAEREIVDLIWFPTGGGKTEAYLGLTAFTILWRRLNNPSNAGTVALMRYTLRLLTTQQFQRAASLICACEKIRRDDPFGELGEDPITIGLWVGGGVTPNDEKRAVSALNRIQSGDRENPFIILSCPWCGAQMGPVKSGQKTIAKGYHVLMRPKRVRFVCDDQDCEFSTTEGLPLKVIDEHIYNDPPTLVVGTVDKFALLPWEPKARALFGLANINHDPPDLIIQDELHLISGPLGSMTGHYETVVNALTSREYDGRRAFAKIIASTATIARAGEQIKALYGGREGFLFPPQALKAGDSFFAEERDNLDGRTYLGVFTSGLPSQVTSVVRTLSTLLQAPRYIEEVGDEEIDPYWTSVVYFNSIRELGRAATLLKADIPEYMRVTWRRLGLEPKWGGENASQRRFINEDMELTSRIQNSEITECMERLFVPYPGTEKNRPVDVCLATNMIQVGLDVQRLSLMAMVGQPKTVSEYIQASSRVGRSGKSPGLVATLLSPAKPRDRSHFEHFRAFHQSIYRFVEPTSITPFALPVAERALHALVITLVRFWGEEKERNSPNPPPSQALEDRIRKEILDRVGDVEVGETKRVKMVLDRIFGEWRRLPPQIYGNFRAPDDQVPLMYPSGTHPEREWKGRSHPTPSSMRNVDAGCNANIVSFYPDTSM